MAESISFQLSGLVVVFLVLGSIWFLLEILGKIFAFRAKSAPKTQTIVCPGAPAPAPAAAAPVAAPMPVPAASDDISPETVVLVAAAVHLALGGAAHRIVSITPQQSAHGLHPHAHWAMEGRRQIFASHRPR